jgi:hypothetical protein
MFDRFLKFCCGKRGGAANVKIDVVVSVVEVSVFDCLRRISPNNASVFMMWSDVESLSKNKIFKMSQQGANF